MRYYNHYLNFFRKLSFPIIKVTHTTECCEITVGTGVLQVWKYDMSFHENGLSFNLNISSWIFWILEKIIQCDEKPIIFIHRFMNINQYLFLIFKTCSIVFFYVNKKKRNFWTVHLQYLLRPIKKYVLKGFRVQFILWLMG